MRNPCIFIEVGAVSAVAYIVILGGRKSAAAMAAPAAVLPTPLCSTHVNP